MFVAIGDFQGDLIIITIISYDCMVIKCSYLKFFASVEIYAYIRRDEHNSEVGKKTLNL